MTTRRSTVRQVFAWVLLVVSTVLLISFGGAIVAAPVAVPLLVLSARASSSKGYRVWAGIVVVLTVAELVWGLTYLVVGDDAPAIWLVPALVTPATMFGYVRASRCLPKKSQISFHPSLDASRS